jgi:very-short-patch-repair endonuclease
MPTQNIVIGQKVDASKIQRAKELRREMTPAESLLWQRVRARRLNGFHFRRQQVIDGFIVDFYCHAAGLVVEIDGGIHDRQVDYDTQRDRILAARGLRVLRFENRECVENLEGVLGRILAACLGTT